METTGPKLTKDQELASTPHGRARRMVRAAKSRARRKGLPFALPVERVEEALREGRCELTGLPFDLTPVGRWNCHPSAPSLDRIDPEKGYTLDNVQIVCHAVNQLRHQYPPHITRVFAKAFLNATKGETL